MFIENLSQADIKAFLDQKYQNSVTLIPDIHNFENISFKITKGKIICTTIYVKYVFSDFEFTSSSSHYLTESAKYDRAWLNFMYKKFGEDYKNAFLAMREKQKPAAIKKFEKQYDNATDFLESEFTK